MPYRSLAVSQVVILNSSLTRLLLLCGVVLSRGCHVAVQCRNHTVGWNMLTFSPFKPPDNFSDQVLHLCIYHNDKITSLVPISSENVSNVIRKMGIVVSVL